MFRIAAVIPLYNGGPYIERAIQSILEQDRQADEIIIVDDGSNDNGPDLVEAIASKNPKVVLLRKNNGGQGSARNFGVRHSTGDMIAFLDQDDFWYKHHLSVLEKPLIDGRDGRLAYSYADLDHFNADGMMISHRMLSRMPKREHPSRPSLVVWRMTCSLCRVPL